MDAFTLEVIAANISFITMAELMFIEVLLVIELDKEGR